MLRPSTQRLTTTTDPERLLDVDLVVFDLDGTLYEGTDFRAPYLDALQAIVGDGGPDLAALYQQVRDGHHVLQLGDLFHIEEARIVRPVAEPPNDRFGLRVHEVLDLDGRHVEPPHGVDGSHVAFGAPVSYVGDPWQIITAISRMADVDARQRHDAFVTARHRMNGSDYDLGVPPCLWSLLDRFRHVPRRILVTNTEEVLGRDVVTRLGVADRFTDLVFGAAKPVGLAALLATRIGDGVDPARVLCVGDNYWNDVLPAYQLGAQSVLIDPFGIDRVSDAPLHLHDLTQLDRLLDGHPVPSFTTGGAHR